MDKKILIQKVFSDHLDVISRLADQGAAETIVRMSEALVQALESGNKILLFGNGGSAADAQHLAAEFIGRFQEERRALPAIALNTNTSNLTALSNDYSYEIIFERQIEALGKPGDVSIGFTTSGRSNNVVRAQGKAKDMGLKTIAFIGNKPSSLSEICDVTFSVPSDNTARIQEGHILAGHILCHCVEQSLFNS